MIRETGVVDPPAASRAANDEVITENALVERMQTLALVLFGPGDGDDPLATAAAKKIECSEEYVLDSIATLRSLADDYGNDDFDAIVALLETQCGRRYAT